MNSLLKITFAAAISAIALCVSTAFGETNASHFTEAKKVNNRYQYDFPEASSTGADLHTPARSGGSFYENWIRDRLSVGLGVTTFSLTKNYRTPDLNRKHNFIGAVNELHEVRDFLLTPVVDYRVCDYCRVELSYADITASTENFNNHVGDGHVQYLGPTLAIEGTYPLLDGKLIPHVGVGIAFLWGDFEEDTWWHLGYSSYDNWVYYGKSWKSRQNYFREIYVDEFMTPVFFNLGLTYRFNGNWSADFTARHMSLDPDCEWGYYYTKGFQQHNTGDFDLSHFAYTLSVSYTF